MSSIPKNPRARGKSRRKESDPPATALRVVAAPPEWRPPKPTVPEPFPSPDDGDDDEPILFSPGEDRLRRLSFPDLNDAQFAFVLEFCRRNGLDPFRNHVHAVARRDEVRIVVSIHALRELADASGKYRGRLGPQWCGPDGVWKDVWTAMEPPVAARVGVLRKGIDGPFWGIAHWDCFAQWRRDENGDLTIDPFWGKLGVHMLAKQAEKLALLAAFPFNPILPGPDMAIGGAACSS